MVKKADKSIIVGRGNSYPNPDLNPKGLRPSSQTLQLYRHQQNHNSQPLLHFINPQWTTQTRQHVT